MGTTSFSTLSLLYCTAASSASSLTSSAAIAQTASYGSLANGSTLAGPDSSEAPDYISAVLNVPLTMMLTLVLGAMILFTTIGNLFVIVAVLTERNLQRPQHYLIVSLAVADLAVGIGVLPLSAMYEITRRKWIFGALLCEGWIFMDVLACSASILHLVVIALDRYWSITDVRYSQQRKSHKIYLMIGVVWLLSLLISILPIVGWKDENYQERIRNQICLLSQDAGFQSNTTQHKILHKHSYRRASRVEGRESRVEGRGSPFFTFAIFFAISSPFGRFR